MTALAALLFFSYLASAVSLACPVNQVCLFYGIIPEKTTTTNIPTASFICPTTYPISQPYNPTTQNQPRLGIEINTPSNTEIYAAQSGKITQTPYDQNNLGTTLTIQHSDNPDIKTLYGHLKDTNNLRPGDSVKKGDVIGHTTNHLYFELDRNNKPTNEVQDICKNNKNTPAPIVAPIANAASNPNPGYDLKKCFQELDQINPSRAQNQGVYRQMADKAAQDYGISQDIFKKQITQESQWNPNAGSPAGAGGLAQFMPGTASGFGIDRFNPSQALCGAAKYDAQLYVAASSKSYCNGKQYTCALAGYNAGFGNVQKYQGVPPFDETQKYVKIILGDQVGIS